MAKPTKAKVRSKVQKGIVDISREVWEWARTNPRSESLLEELEDLEDLRRERAKGVRFAEVLKEYEAAHNVRLE
jgi:hypothetical protein